MAQRDVALGKTGSAVAAKQRPARVSDLGRNDDSGTGQLIGQLTRIFDFVVDGEGILRVLALGGARWSTSACNAAQLQIVGFQGQIRRRLAERGSRRRRESEPLQQWHDRQANIASPQILSAVSDN